MKTLKKLLLVAMMMTLTFGCTTQTQTPNQSSNELAQPLYLSNEPFYEVTQPVFENNKLNYTIKINDVYLQLLNDYSNVGRDYEVALSFSDYELPINTRSKFTIKDNISEYQMETTLKPSKTDDLYNAYIEKLNKEFVSITISLYARTNDKVLKKISDSVFFIEGQKK